MKKITMLFLLSVLIGGLSNSFGQTNVGGNYFTNQHWTLSGSPYIVNSSVNIPSGVTLTIDPGVDVIFNGNFELLIMGEIVANGTDLNNITFLSNKNFCTFINLKNTVLSNSQFSYLKFIGDTAQIDYWSSVTTYPTAIKTEGTCTDSIILNSVEFKKSFINNNKPIYIFDGEIDSLRTDASSLTVFKNSTISNIHIGNEYGDNEVYLEFENSYINNLTIEINGGNLKMLNSNFYNSNFNSSWWAGIMIDDFNIINSRMIDSDLHLMTRPNAPLSSIIGTKFSNCNVDINNWWDNLNLRIDSTFLIYSTLSIGSGISQINNSIIKHDTIQTINFNGNINNSIFIGSNNCLGGIGLDNVNGVINNSAIINNRIGLQTSNLIINNTNLYSNQQYTIKNTGTNQINAQNNYWVDTDSVSIKDKIFDFYDDISLGKVIIGNYLFSPNTTSPIMPPQNFIKNTIANNVLLSWSANPESDIAGYKVHYGNFDGFSFENTIDVGNVTSYTLSGIDFNEIVLVTAYDTDADGVNDMIEGHESWYCDDLYINAIIVSADTIDICQGNNTVLHANSYPFLNYQWLKDGVSIGSNIDSLIVNQAGCYRVIVANINGCKDTSNVVVVNVNSLSIQNFTSTIVCGKIIQLNNTINYTGNNTVNYSWISDPSLDNIGIAHPNANPINTTTYTVNATDGVCQATATATITVNSLTANAGSDKALVCGGSTQLDNVSSNYTGIGTLIYSWSPSTGLNDANIANPTATITADQTYNVTVTTDNGCVATDEVVVTVNPLMVNAGNDKTIICGGIAQLDNVSSNYTGSGTLTYSWSPSTGLNDATIANPTATITADQTYNVTVTTDNGCSATDFINVSLIPMINPDICIVGVNDVNKNIIVWDKPVSVAIDSFFIYRETNITNVYQKIGSVPYDSLSVFVDTASQPSVQSNKYKISLIDNCNFETSQSDYHKTMHLSINQGVGTTWNLNWDSYEGFTVSTYNVYRGTDPNNLTLIGTSSGSNTSYSDISAPSGYVYYQVELVSPTPCNPSKSIISSRSNIATNNLSVGMLSIVEDNIRIYPNPATDIFIIEGLETGLIEIINSTGQVIKIVNVTNTKTNIDVSKLSGGVYTMRIKTNNGIIVKKLIKQ